MIGASNPVPYPVAPAPGGAERKVLRMVTNERTAGSMPAWERPATRRQQVEQTLSLAQSGESSSLSSTLAYRPSPETRPTADQEFGFADLVDMINPLQHIPVVGHFYREMTGDEIKPISRIIGGAVFGGALGATASLANVIVEKETGRDIAGNAMALAFNDDAPVAAPVRLAVAAPGETPGETPEETLGAAMLRAQGMASGNDLPDALLAFSSPGLQSGIVIERTQAASGRTAGTMARAAHAYNRAEGLAGRLPRREPISEVTMRTMPYDLY